MKKVLYILAIIATVITFTGCYSGRAVVVARPPMRRVMVAPYYYPGPVVVHGYGGRGWHKGGRYRGY